MLLAISLEAANAKNPSLEFSKDLLIVEANVTVVSERDGYIVGAATVTRDFLGNLDGFNHSFEIVSRDQPVETRAAIVFPIVQPGEVMLCFVKRNGAKLEHVTGYGYGFIWPVRRTLNPQDFKSAAQLAQTMARLAHVRDDKEKFKVLADAFLSPDSNVGIWAGNQLRSNAANLVPPAFFREQINNESLSDGAILELDLALLQLDGKRWQHSAERFNMFNRRLSAESPEIDTPRVFQHLGVVSQHPQEQGFEVAPLLSLLRTAVNNEKLSVNARSRVASVVGWIPQRYEDDELAFQFAVETIENSDDPKIQKEMARVLIHFFELDRDRRRAVVSLMYQLIDAQASDKHEAGKGAGGSF